MSQDRVSHERLLRDLQDLGLAEGDVVLVHSSLSGLGWVEGGADTVIDVLLAAVGESGTVLFPALTGSDRDAPEHPPVIDLATTPCWTGAIPETARQRANAIRSIHPTHSVVAIGRQAEGYAAGHEHSRTPCDAQSPYVRLMDDGGKILLLGGVTHESNTSLHALEELANVPYHLQDEVTDGIVVMPDGRRIVVRNRLHLWRNRYLDANLVRNFGKVQAPLEAAGAIDAGPVGASTSLLMGAGAIRDVILPILADDPLFLLAEDGRG